MSCVRANPAVEPCRPVRQGRAPFLASAAAIGAQQGSVVDRQGSVTRLLVGLRPDPLDECGRRHAGHQWNGLDRPASLFHDFAPDDAIDRPIAALDQHIRSSAVIKFRGSGSGKMTT